jgi:hypothetical protein
VLGCVSTSQAHSRVSNINFDIWIFFCGGGLYKYPMTNILRRAKFLPTWAFNQKVLAVPLTNWSTWVGFCTSSPQQGVKYQLWYLKFCLWRGSLLIFHEKYIKESKVLTHLGLQSKVLAGPLTDWSVWVGFCTPIPQQGVKYQLGYLIFLEGGLYKYPMKILLRTAKFFPTWDVDQRNYPGL